MLKNIPKNYFEDIRKTAALFHFVPLDVKQSNRTVEQKLTPQAYQLGLSVLPPPPNKQTASDFCFGCRLTEVENLKSGSRDNS